VDCSKLSRHIPGFATTWDVRRGATELYESFVRHGLTTEMFAGFMRIHRIQMLLASSQLDASLAWRAPQAAAV
jgi:hypothetical protein